MSTRHALVLEQIETPSRSRVRKIIGQSHVAANFRMKEGYLYTVVRAISARVNQNYDGWPSYELKQAAHTFVGKPCFVNHENFDPKKARGVVVAARYREAGQDKFIETVMEIDAKRFPILANEIRSGGLDSVSMGAEAGFTICSACGNQAFDEPDMCDHVRHHKGEKLHVRNRRTGKVEEKLVYESCHKLSFFELSYVFDPADETAVASKVVMGARRKTADCPPEDPNCNPGNTGVPDSGNADIGLQGHGGGDKASDLGKTPAVGGGATGGGKTTDLGKTPSQGGSPTGLLPGAQSLKDLYLKENPKADIGGFNPNVDQPWDEHATGKAIDYMNPTNPDQTRQEAFDNGANYVLWQQKQWNPDGTTSPMEDRGSPTENHFDHMHINVGSVRGAVLAKLAQRIETQRIAMEKIADATDDYLEWAKKVDSGETVPEKGDKISLPNKSLTDWSERTRKRTAADFAYPPNENSQKTQVSNTGGTYVKAHDYFNATGAPQGNALDYGAGLGHSSQFGDTFEPHPRPGFQPTHTDSASIPDGAYHRVTNLNVLNVVPPEVRNHIVGEIGRVMAPGGHAVITTRGRDVMDAKGTPGPEPMSMVVGQGPQARYQKGFTRPELHKYVSDTLGPGYTVKPVPIGPAGVHIVRHAGITSNLKERVAVAIYRKLAWGEVEAPPAVDTLREEGSAPEDDNDDFHHYVESPTDLSMPDLSEATQLDRQQEDSGQGAPGEGPDPTGDPGVQDDEGQYMTLKIPVPPAAPAGPPAGPPASATPMGPPAPMPMPPGGGMPPAGAPPAAPPTGAAPQTQVPMQAFGSKVSALTTLAYFERYYGYRVANWLDAIEAGRDFTPEEHADYIREAAVATLENTAADSPTSRNPVKGTANMARSTLATRRKTAGTRHYAEGPLTDGGDVSRNDQGEQEEAFITETPEPDSTDLPDDDTQNISNTEGNLVADEAYAHSLTAKLQQQKRELEATAREYQRITSRRKTADEFAGGPTATEVNPEVPTSSAEQLTGDDFDSADPNPSIDTSVAGPGTTTLPIESSLQAFRAFDKWLTAGTGKNSRQHNEANIKKAATQFANYNGIPVQAMFPALGIALRQARKTEAALKAKKGSKMQRRAVDLETAAPDERVSVPAPVADTTDAEAQASQFAEDGWDNNAGKDITEVDLSTGQNFAPGQAPGKSARKADGILAVRCAEAMIAAGLEENTRERKYQLAAEFEKMSRGLILDRTALAERFAMVRHADRQKVASGSTRGAARSPIPAGLGQGGSTRPTPRTAANLNHPDNDGLMFG